MTLEGSEKIKVEVNRTLMELPVIKVKDDRGSERWFLDSEENPLMAKQAIRQFSQTLASITTDRPNTLRWIKGKKLTNPH
jgi:arginine repressor